MDSTYYAPPAARRRAGSAVESAANTGRLPFDVKAYSLLTGHPTRPRRLWPDLRERLPVEIAQKRNVYAKHLDPEALGEAWRRFEAALAPFRVLHRDENVEGSVVLPVGSLWGLF